MSYGIYLSRRSLPSFQRSYLIQLPDYEFRKKSNAIIQIRSKVAPNKQLSPKCSLYNSTYVWLCSKGHPQKHTGSDGDCIQCLHGIANGGFFSQQDFRDAYCMRPESRKDMPSAMKHCPP